MKTGFKIVAALALASVIYWAARGWFAAKKPHDLAPQERFLDVEPSAPKQTEVSTPLMGVQKNKSDLTQTDDAVKKQPSPESHGVPIDTSVLMPEEDDTCSPKKKEPCGEETHTQNQEKEKLPF